MRIDMLVRRSCSVVLPVVAGLALLSPPALGQQTREAEAAILRQAVTGRVLMPDGAPASGAVVVTSAGGECVTGADGRFELAVNVPLEAESLEVTAVADGRAGSGDLVARMSIVPASLSPLAPVGVLVLAHPAACIPRWRPTFDFTGTDGEIGQMVVFDDDAGPALYAGGQFTTAGDVSANNIAKWDGSRWSALGSGMNATVNALMVHDDGSGPALYAGGDFTTAGGVPASRIAKWDGSGWSALGSGQYHVVRALTVYDDGSGPALYAGGHSIAKWDGTSWSALGSGVEYYVWALTVFDDGGGPALYAGGNFSRAGGLPANNIAKWDGSSWSALGSGTQGGMFGRVSALTVYDDGSGPALYASGDFTSAGDVPANHIAKWDGSSWSALGSGLNGPADLTVFDDGSGPALYAGSSEEPRKWDGSSWSVLSGAPGVVNLTGYDDGSGPSLYATSGDPTAAGKYLFWKWDSSDWSTPGNGIDDEVHALAVHDDGGGPALVVAGSLTSAAGVTVNRIAQWDGSHWSALGSGMASGGGGTTPSVDALAVYDGGSGPELYAGGNFLIAGGEAANHIAKWDGSGWSALGSGVTAAPTVSPAISALAVHDDGSGPALYAGGLFFSAGGVTVNYIARWDGSSWSALGSGMDKSVRCLAVYDDGGGPRLYAGGHFTTAGGVAASKIARWDGSSWSALGSGMDKGVMALAVHDDGSGPALYAAGTFSTAGGVTANGIAKWDGASWAPLGTGLSPVATSWIALAVYDEGAGSELIVGGAFTSAGGVAANRIARWDGASWSALGSGMDKPVLCLTVHDDGSGPALYAGGRFITSPARDSYLAKWACKSKPSVKKRKL